MTRARSAAAAQTPNTALIGHVIHETSIYTAAQVQQLLGLRKSTLGREIREHGLRVIKRCGKYFFLGSDLLDWLERGRLRPTATTEGAVVTDK